MPAGKVFLLAEEYARSFEDLRCLGKASGADVGELRAKILAKLAKERGEVLR